VSIINLSTTLRHRVLDVQVLVQEFVRHTHVHELGLTAGAAITLDTDTIMIRLLIFLVLIRAAYC